MRSAQPGQLAVDLDQPGQQRRRRHRLTPVRGTGKLVQIVPDPRQLAQKIGGNRRCLTPGPQPRPVQA